MARMGRPKLENPRSEGVFIRLTKDEHTDITEYASSHDLDVYKRQVGMFGENSGRAVH